QRGLAGPGHPGDHQQLAGGQIEIQVLQVVLARTANTNGVGHAATSGRVAARGAAAMEGTWDGAGPLSGDAPDSSQCRQGNGAPRTGAMYSTAQCCQQVSCFNG